MHTCVLKQSLTIVEFGISAEFILIMLYTQFGFFLKSYPYFSGTTYEFGWTSFINNGIIALR